MEGQAGVSTVTDITLVVAGKAVGKGRPRFDPRTRRAYTDSTTRLAERRVQAEWIAAGRPRLPDGAIVMTIEIAVARPQSHLRTNGELNAAGLRAPWPLRKPDVDNAAKNFADALSGLAFRDDKDIVHLWVLRRWCQAGEHEHTLIRLRPAPEPAAQVQAVTPLDGRWAA